MKNSTRKPQSAPAADHATSIGPIPRLERIDARVAALAIDRAFVPVSGSVDLAAGRRPTRLRAPRRLMLDGRPVVASGRFWKSLFHTVRIDDGVFRLFSAEEVLGRLAERDSRRTLRFTVEQHPGGTDRLVGVASRSSASLDAVGAIALLEGHGAEHVTYADGVLTSRHLPADGPGKFRIGADAFENRFTVELPLDGYGEPRTYVTLLRLVCANGAVGLSRAFRAVLRLGDDPWHSLDRALGAYANADGFSAMRRRFESAQRSWASLAEVGTLERVLQSITWGAGEHAGRRRAAFERLVGDLPSTYGVASVSSLSPKQRRLLPSRTRVYDLLNFATEVATHHAPPAAATRLQAWLTTAVSDEFDLEGSADRLADFEALHLPALPDRGSAPRQGRAS